MNNHVMYVLSCDHVALSAPALITDGRAWCGQCGEQLKIIGVHQFEWHMSCQVCKYSRWTGTSERLAQQIAGAHSRSTYHETWVKYERNPVAKAEMLRLNRAKAILCSTTHTLIG